MLTRSPGDFLCSSLSFDSQMFGKLKHTNRENCGKNMLSDIIYVLFFLDEMRKYKELDKTEALK